MADTLAARVLTPAPIAEGSAAADTTDTRRPSAPDAAPFTGPVAIQLVLTDRTLTGGNEPAHFAGGEPYPAPLARDLALAATTDGRIDPATARTVRRLFTDPTGRLITAETTSRQFTPAMRQLVMLRDGTCTTPWCDAPITDIDHHDPAAHGGPTATTNARGLCRWCNVTKSDQPPRAPDPDSGPPPRTRPTCSPVERRARRHLRRAIRQVRSAPSNQVRTPPETVTLRP